MFWEFESSVIRWMGEETERGGRARTSTGAPPRAPEHNIVNGSVEFQKPWLNSAAENLQLS